MERSEGLITVEKDEAIVKLPEHVAQVPLDTMEKGGDRPTVIPTPQPWPNSTAPATTESLSPLGQLLAKARTGYDNLPPRIRTFFPAAGAFLMTLVRLSLISAAMIFIVMLASFSMAVTHWAAVILGHIVLHYTLPGSLDEQFADASFNQTMIFAAVGAIIVNLLPFLVFLLSFPCTVNRNVLETSAMPAHDLLQRITPRNRYARTAIKYAPRLTAGPIGCAVFWIMGDVVNEGYAAEVLDPLHAAIAGLVGEFILTGLSKLKNALTSPKPRTPDAAEAERRIEEGLPL